jgi:hypothetical protein
VSALRLNNSLHRASGGRVMGQLRGVPVLLITVAGRKTGVKHSNPVLHLEDDGRFVMTGSGHRRKVQATERQQHMQADQSSSHRRSSA